MADAVEHPMSMADAVEHPMSMADAVEHPIDFGNTFSQVALEEIDYSQFLANKIESELLQGWCSARWHNALRAWPVHAVSDIMQDALEKSSNATGGIFDFKCQGSTCFGIMGSLRVLLGVVFYHTFLLLCTINSKSRNDIQGTIHSGLWLLKFLILTGLIIACFFIPDTSVTPFFWACFVGSIFFIMWHTLSLLGVAYTWAETWRQQADNNRGYMFGLLFFTASFLIGTIVLTVFMFLYFTEKSGCDEHKFVISFNLVLVVVALIVSVLPKVQEHNKSSGILQVSLLTFFQTYLLWSALSSHPPDSCNNFSSAVLAQNVPMYTGMILLFLIILWHATNADRKPSPEEDSNKRTQWNEMYIDEDSESTAKNAPPEYSYTTFHLTFIFGAMYACMIISNWNRIIEQNNTFVLDQTLAAFWVQHLAAFQTENFPEFEVVTCITRRFNKA
eukprot:gene3102-8198_t